MGIGDSTITTAGVVLAAALGAYLAYRGALRQRAWESVFEDKRKAFDAFLVAVDAFSASINATMNFQRSQEFGVYDMLATQSGLVTDLYGADPAQSTDEYVRQTWSAKPTAAKLSAKGADQQALVAQFLTGASNLMAQANQRAYNDLRAAHSRLAFVLFDPEAARPLLDKARAVVNALFQAPRPFFDGHDLRTFADEWKPLVIATRRKMRKDLQFSAKSFGKAIAVDKKWLGQR